MRKISPLIVALDLENLDQVDRIVAKLGSAVNFYKVGMKLFTHYGPDIIRYLKQKKKSIFLDLKFHDIPNTVAEACREAVRLKVHMLTLHASGGSEMMKAAAKAIREESLKKNIVRPWIMGVTVLTSMGSLDELGIPRGPARQVVKLTQLAVESRLDGVICSPHEIHLLRPWVPANFKIVTPGVRPAGSAKGDQKRVMTPRRAFSLGANSIVVGRPILNDPKPLDVVRRILESRR